VEKFCIAEQTTDDGMAHDHSMLNIEDYKHTVSECVIFIACASLLRYKYIACLVKTQQWVEL
jgi:hypothetical protein